tara:strand:- start:59 stop:451 length:393 start_codon:yes stop_codon:yes gene_type:complete
LNLNTAEKALLGELAPQLAALRGVKVCPCFNASRFLFVPCNLLCVLIGVVHVVFFASNDLSLARGPLLEITSLFERGCFHGDVNDEVRVSTVRLCDRLGSVAPNKRRSRLWQVHAFLDVHVGITLDAARL